MAPEPPTGPVDLDDNQRMSSPARQIQIHCKGCGTTYYSLSYRPIINLTTEEWTAQEVRASTTATCPECSLEVQLTALLVDGGEYRVLTESTAPKS